MMNARKRSEDDAGQRPVLSNSVYESFAIAIETIEQDFHRLVEALERTIELAGSADAELLEQLSITKTVAERGLHLSRDLLNLARHRPANR